MGGELFKKVIAVNRLKKKDVKIPDKIPKIHDAGRHSYLPGTIVALYHSCNSDG